MLIAGLSIPVFPLRTIDQYMDGYYMDRDGTVYSTKGRNGVAKINGTPSGRYYTLNKRTHRAADLVRRAKHHRDFNTETSAPLADVKAATAAQLGVAGLPPGRTKSARAAASVKGYLLATIGPTDKLVFGTDPVLHLSDTTAKAEAERVASESGKEVVLLQIVGKVKVQRAVWE